MRWCYRFVRETADDESEEWIDLKEIYYDDDDKIIGYSDSSIGGLNEEEIRHVAQRVLFASRQPILDDTDLDRIIGGNNV